MIVRNKYCARRIKYLGYGFWEAKPAEHREAVGWAKVLELLAIDRLIDPGECVSAAPGTV
jgi:hypothetical protein